jgi:hypothetical protein
MVIMVNVASYQSRCEHAFLDQQSAREPQTSTNRPTSQVGLGRNVEVMWLTGRVVPDHKTIADFRKDNGRVIRQRWVLPFSPTRFSLVHTGSMAL